jgi:hypothetical protein
MKKTFARTAPKNHFAYHFNVSEAGRIYQSAGGGADLSGETGPKIFI